MSAASTSSEPALYLDSSAVVKLIVEEPETDPLLGVVRDRDLISSEIALTEVQRAIRRLLNGRQREAIDSVTGAMELVLSSLAWVPVTRALLLEAGSYGEVWLRALDAIHVASALAVREDIEAMVSYDERQANAAARAGLATLAPA